MQYVKCILRVFELHTIEQPHTIKTSIAALWNLVCAKYKLGKLLAYCIITYIVVRDDKCIGQINFHEVLRGLLNYFNVVRATILELISVKGWEVWSSL